MAVDLESDTVARGRLDDALEIEARWFTPQENAAGGMRNDVHERVRDGAQHARGNFRLFLPDCRVHRRDDEIELGEAFVGEIERAVRQDVAFDSGEHLNALDALVERADSRRMLERAPFVEAVGHGQRLAVIGNRDVAATGCASGEDHGLELVLPVGGGRVHVEVAAQVAVSNERRQRAFRGRRDLAAVFAKFWRNPRETERLVHAFFGLTGEPLFIVHPVEAVLVETHAAIDGAIA